jgi:hypothetical protein
VTRAESERIGKPWKSPQQRLHFSGTPVAAIRVTPGFCKKPL